eukprot:4820154-Amphidinium_carterae.2
MAAMQTSPAAQATRTHAPARARARSTGVVGADAARTHTKERERETIASKICWQSRHLDNLHFAYQTQHQLLLFINPWRHVSTVSNQWGQASLNAAHATILATFFSHPLDQSLGLQRYLQEQFARANVFQRTGTKTLQWWLGLCEEVHLKQTHPMAMNPFQVPKAHAWPSNTSCKLTRACHAGLRGCDDVVTCGPVKHATPMVLHWDAQATQCFLLLSKAV